MGSLSGQASSLIVRSLPRIDRGTEPDFNGAMISLTLQEAQLLRLLGAIFGVESVVPNMSVLAVCGGTLPDALDRVIWGPTEMQQPDSEELQHWARSSKLLFTVVDHQNEPRLVVEFQFDSQMAIEAHRARQQQFLVPVLQAAKVPYITLSQNEFEEVLDPEASLDFPTLLHDKMMHSPLPVKEGNE